MTQNTSRVFIYGSCVSRDSYEYFNPAQFPLVSYVARQSLVSSFSKAATFVSLDDSSGLTSSFQNRMLRGDLTSSLPRLIREHAADIDLLLCDFVDERGGVIGDAHGEFVTKSLAFDESGIGSSLAPATHQINFGTDEHFELWKCSFEAFLDLLTELDLIDKLVILRHQWALETIQGDVFPMEGSKMLPAVINARFDRYYSYAMSRRPESMLVVPRNLCVATREHKWGPAPFHYHSAFYRYVVAAIQDMRSSNV